LTSGFAGFFYLSVQELEALPRTEASLFLDISSDNAGIATAVDVVPDLLGALIHCIRHGRTFILQICRTQTASPFLNHSAVQGHPPMQTTTSATTVTTVTLLTVWLIVYCSPTVVDAFCVTLIAMCQTHAS
jgi:hypothetical protein